MRSILRSHARRSVPMSFAFPGCGSGGPVDEAEEKGFAPPMRSLPWRIAVLAGLLLGSAGCSYLNEPREPPEKVPFVRVEVNSTPAGAMISKDGQKIGRAPVTVTIETAEDGSMLRDVLILGDFGTNAMTPNITDAGIYTITRGEFAPREVKFKPAGGGTVSIEPIGRALTQQPGR
jgi:hypothetical protein